MDTRFQNYRRVYQGIETSDSRYFAEEKGKRSRFAGGLMRGNPWQVAKGLPTVVTIAARNPEVALRAQAVLSTSRFRCYTTDDVEGDAPRPLPSPYFFARDNKETF